MQTISEQVVSIILDSNIIDYKVLDDIEKKRIEGHLNQNEHKDLANELDRMLHTEPPREDDILQLILYFEINKIPRLCSFIGDFYMKRGNEDEAKRYWQIGTERNDPFSMEKLGNLLMTEGKLDEGYKLYIKSLYAGNYLVLKKISIYKNDSKINELCDNYTNYKHNSKV